MIKLLSFDLQGTISSSDFCDTFWLELLPNMYAKKHGLTLEKAKEQLKNFFKAIGKYDRRYYDERYWEKELNFDAKETLLKMKKPVLNQRLLNIVKNSKLPVVILSTTTRTFIDFELGATKKLFVKTFSCIDDFNISGKTDNAFLNLAKQMNVSPDEILHIGDDEEMDILNALKAGCHAFLFKGDESINQLRELIDSLAEAE